MDQNTFYECFYECFMSVWGYLDYKHVHLHLHLHLSNLQLEQEGRRPISNQFKQGNTLESAQY